MPKRIWRQICLATIALAVLSIAVQAQEPNPARKDSSARIRPKQATMTTEIVPAEAKAGESVKYTVKVALEKGFHIFKYKKELAEPGQPHDNEL